MKRYIYIILGIVIAAAIAIGILFLIKNRSASPSLSIAGTTAGTLPLAGTQGATGTQNSAPAAAAGLSLSGASGTASSSGQATVQNFGVLSNDPVIDYFINAQNIITAIEPMGPVVTISNGQSTIINSSTINGIISAGFSYDGKKIVVSYGDPTNPQTSIFDVAANTWTPLPQGMLSPQWSPINNYQIAYFVATGSGKLALQTINAANTKATPSTLLSFNANGFNLRWPTQSEFIFSDKPTTESAGSVWAFNSAAGTLAPLIYEAPGAEGIWSNNASIPYGLTFFDNSSGQGGDTLQLQAISGSLPTQPLSFLTLPSKCVFNTELMPIATSTATSTTSGATATKKIATVAPTSTPYLALYCGIPRSSSGFSSARLPDDYNTMALFTSDDIYKINTATGAEQSLWSDATQNMDVSDMKFFNNALFFLNRYDQKLYGLTFN